MFASVLAISMRHKSCRDTVGIYCFTPSVLIRMATWLVLWSKGFSLKCWRFPLCRRHGACLIVTSHLLQSHWQNLRCYGMEDAVWLVCPCSLFSERALLAYPVASRHAQRCFLKQKCNFMIQQDPWNVRFYWASYEIPCYKEASMFIIMKVLPSGT